jgi:hypothetical protein
VVPPDAFVGRTLSISGLASAIPVDETVEAALAALASRVTAEPAGPEPSVPEFWQRSACRASSTCTCTSCRRG